MLCWGLHTNLLSNTFAWDRGGEDLIFVEWFSICKIYFKAGHITERKGFDQNTQWLCCQFRKMKGGWLRDDFTRVCCKAFRQGTNTKYFCVKWQISLWYEGRSTHFDTLSNYNYLCATFCVERTNGVRYTKSEQRSGFQPAVRQYKICPWLSYRHTWHHTGCTSIEHQDMLIFLLYALI